MLSLFLFGLLLDSFTSASLLLVDRNSSCRAYGNASVYDITNLVPQWPTGIVGTGFDGRVYIYWWSCVRSMRRCDSDDVAVCQQQRGGSMQEFNAGSLSSQLWFGQFNGVASESNLTWSIMYQNHQSDPSQIDGSGIRVTTIYLIVDPNVDKPQLTMNGEKPYTEYSITVRGKCIGQHAVNHTSHIQGYCDPATGQVMPGLNIN
ncbi:unnamed protein product [Rotaria socialis]